MFTDALVRSDLVEQIPNVALICLEAPHLYGDVLRSYLLGIIIKYLSDPDNQASLVLNTFLQDAKYICISRYDINTMNCFCSAGTTNGSQRAHDDREEGSSWQRYNRTWNLSHDRTFVLHVGRGTSSQRKHLRKFPALYYSLFFYFLLIYWFEEDTKKVVSEMCTFA